MSQIDKLRNEIENCTRSHFAAVRRSASADLAALDSLISELTGLRALRSGLEDKNKRLESSQETVSLCCDGLRTKLREADTRIAELETQVNALQNSFDSVAHREDLVCTELAAEKLRGAAYETEAEKRIAELEAARRDGIDFIDLMVDELARIKNIAGHDMNRGPEIVGLCERGIKQAWQKVPVIEQRDKAEARVRELETAIRKSLGSIDPDSDSLAAHILVSALITPEDRAKLRGDVEAHLSPVAKEVKS